MDNFGEFEKQIRRNCFVNWAKLVCNLGEIAEVKVMYEKLRRC